MDAEIDALEGWQGSEGLGQDFEIADSAAVRRGAAEDEVEGDVADVLSDGRAGEHGEGLCAVAVARAGDKEVPVHILVEEVAGFGEDGFVQREDG